jgi:hypothetical protein
VTYFELGQLIGVLKGIVDEISKVLPNQVLPRFQLFPEEAKIWDKKNPAFWSPGIADTISSGALKLRPYQTRRGYYMIFMLFPKVFLCNLFSTDI